MADMNNGATLRFKNKVYVINPSFPLVREIEHELGSIPSLLDRFLKMGWKVSDLVTLTHIMLQSVGETVDYLHLGNQMLREGLRHYLLSAQSFLQITLQAE